MSKIKVTGNRNSLAEGRTYGLGFAMAKKTGEDSFETVQAPSCCKDYLNDIVLVERHNITAEVNVYGLIYKRTGKVLNEDGSGYLYITPLGHKGASESDSSNESNFFSVKQERTNLDNKIGVIVATLNEFEEKMGFPTRTTAIKMDNVEAGYIMCMPQEWTTSPAMISAYSLMIRLAQYIQMDEDKPTYLSIFRSIPSLDYSMMPRLNQFLSWMLATKMLPPFDPTYYKFSPSNVHSNGMQSFQINSTTHGTGASNTKPAITMNTSGYIHFADGTEFDERYASVLNTGKKSIKEKVKAAFVSSFIGEQIGQEPSMPVGF